MQPDFLTDEDVAAGERVVPRGARERSPRAPSADQLPPQARELTQGVVVAFHGLFADVLSGGDLLRCALRGRLEIADSAWSYNPVEMCVHSKDSVSITTNPGLGYETPT